MEQNRKAREKMATIPRDRAILSTRGILPFILRPAQSVDAYRGFSAKRPHYHYLVLERALPDIGPTVSPEEREEMGEVEKAISRCRPHAHDIYIDTHHLFFAKGDFMNCAYLK